MLNLHVPRAPPPPPSFQTTASRFFNDIMYGGATYMATGRGFSYTPTSWIVMWCSYGRSHIYLGFELGLLLVVLASTGDCIYLDLSSRW